MSAFGGKGVDRAITRGHVDDAVDDCGGKNDPCYGDFNGVDLESSRIEGVKPTLAVTNENQGLAVLRWGDADSAEVRCTDFSLPQQVARQCVVCAQHRRSVDDIYDSAGDRRRR